MRFSRIANALYCRPWAIEGGVYAAMHDVFMSRILGDKLDASVQIFGQTIEYDAPYDYEVIDRVAVVKVSGILDKRLDAIDKACMGATDYDDVSLAVSMANADGQVDAIVIDFDTPGGSVVGLAESADMLSESVKPVVAYTETQMASAGYFMATGADLIVCSPSAEVGCIGTLQTWVDVSKAYEMMGMKREMVSSGKYKGMGWPGASLTDDQRAHLQSEVDALSDEFKGRILSARGDVPADAMEGQMHRSQNAMDAGLIDIIGGLSVALETARELARTGE